MLILKLKVLRIFNYATKLIIQRKLKNLTNWLELFQLFPFKMHCGDYCCCAVGLYQLTVNFWTN